MNKNLNNKIKVCFILRPAYALFNSNSNSNFGGAEVQFYLIAKELAKDTRFEVYFIVGDFNQKDIERKQNIVIIKGYKKNKISSILKLIKVVRKINADYYFITGPKGTNGLIGYLCKKLDKKLAYRTASEIDCNGDFIKNHFFEGILYLYGLKKATFLITQNYSHKQLLEEKHKLNSQVIKNSFCIPKPTKTSKKFILWVSRFDYMKRPEVFLYLAKNFPNERFIMICPSKMEDHKYLLLIKESNKIKNLKFIKKVQFNKIQKYFNKAKVFVNTSDFEGFPNTFIQAGIGKTPILSLNVNPDKFLDSYQCGICVNGDVNKMKENLSSILSNTKKRQKMGNNAYKYVQKNHDIKNNIKQLKTIFLKND